jgi:dihydroorotase
LTESRYHAASLTCAEALEVLRRAKEQGLQVTASASINHLTLNEIDVGPYRTFLKAQPAAAGGRTTVPRWSRRSRPASSTW